MNDELKDLFDSEVGQYYGPDPEFEQIDRAELIKKLEDATHLEELKNSASWRIFREAWRRIFLSAAMQLDNIDPANTARLAEAQITKRFYKDILATTIKKIREDGKSAYEQAKERGWLSKLFPESK